MILSLNIFAKIPFILAPPPPKKRSNLQVLGHGYIIRGGGGHNSIPTPTMCQTLFSAENIAVNVFCPHRGYI